MWNKIKLKKICYEIKVDLEKTQILLVEKLNKQLFFTWRNFFVFFLYPTLKNHHIRFDLILFLFLIYI